MFILRDISLVILALGSAVITLVPLAALAAIIYGLARSRWWRRIPWWFALAHHYLALGRRIIESGCRSAVAPIIAVHALHAGLADGAHRLMGVLTRGHSDAGTR